MKSRQFGLKSSLAWTAIDEFGVKIIGILANIVLARLLAPKDFGSFALISIVYAIFLELSRGGALTSLIRDKYSNQEDFSSIFYANALLAICLYIICYLGAPMICLWLNIAEATVPLRLLSLCLFIEALLGVQRSRLTRKMKFSLLTRINIPAFFLSSILAIYLAFRGLGVMALIYRVIFNGLFQLIFAFKFARWIPEGKISIHKLSKHYIFGYKIMIAGVLNIFYTNVHGLIIGQTISTSALGFFRQGQLLAELPRTTLGKVVDRVSLPMFSDLQDEIQKLRNRSIELMEFSILLIGPIAYFALVTADELIVFLLTDKWADVVPIFQLLCFSAVFSPISNFNNQILKAMGKSNIFLRVSITKKIITTFLLVVSIKWGLYGILISKVLSDISGMLISFYFNSKVINISFENQLKPLIRSFAIVVISALVSYCIHHCVSSLKFSDLFKIIFTWLTGYAVFIVLNEILRLNVYQKARKSFFALISANFN